jgi:hypothetical protein
MFILCLFSCNSAFNIASADAFFMAQESRFSCSMPSPVQTLFAMSTLVRFHLPLSLSRFHTVFVKGIPFGACHGRMPQPVLTCASVVVQFVTSVDGEFGGGI